MPNSPLFHPINVHPINEKTRAVSVRDQIQIALAISDLTLLQNLLTQCIPAIIQPERIAAIASEVGVSLGDRVVADGVLHFEAIQCVLAQVQTQIDHSVNSGTNDSKETARLTQHESDMQSIAQHLPLSPAIALLAKVGFPPLHIQEILRLPHYAWHKSWWYALDADEQFTIPFLRCIRTLHYPDGTLTLQYKDFFEHQKPPCFASLAQKVLVVIRDEALGFGETLQQLNQQRSTLGSNQAILICNTISELEAQAFIHQGVSLYSAMDLVLPTQANCMDCARRECLMNGQEDSLVASCYGFLVDSEFV
jgi:bacterioferritin-associated ferredoxin